MKKTSLSAILILAGIIAMFFGFVQKAGNAGDGWLVLGIAGVVSTAAGAIMYFSGKNKGI